MASNPYPEELYGNPFDGMLEALADEIEVVRKDARRNGVKARPLQLIGEGGRLYETTLNVSKDADVPLIEDTEIAIRFPAKQNEKTIYGVLYSHDPESQRAVIELSSALDPEKTGESIQIMSCEDRLLGFVKDKVTGVRDQGGFANQLVVQGFKSSAIRSMKLVYDHGLDASQKEAVEHCLGLDFGVIWGPPATGKTKTLSALISEAALQGLRVLAVTNANVAVDVLAAKVVESLGRAGAEGSALLDEGLVMRFGHPRLAEVIAEHRLFPHYELTKDVRAELAEAFEELRSIPKQNVRKRATIRKQIRTLKTFLAEALAGALANARVVITTLMQPAMKPAFAEQVFDLVVVDEASMLSIPHVLAMTAFTSGQLVVAGDPKQLPPIVKSSSAMSKQWLHRSIFDLHGTSHPSCVMLKIQYRMKEEICALINEHFYEGRLITATSKETSWASVLPPLDGIPALLLDYTGLETYNTERTSQQSHFNRGSAALATVLVKVIVRTGQTPSVAVITPYRAQVKLLIENLRRDEQLEGLLDKSLRVGTIHTFQGGEADVVIYDVVDDAQKLGRLVRREHGDRLATVALSRAKGKLIILADYFAYTHSIHREAVYEFRNVLLTHFSAERGNLLPAEDAMKTLLTMLKKR